MSSAKKSTQLTMNVMVTIDEHHRDKLDAVAGHLEAAGLNVAEKFTLGGVIVGEVAPANLAKLHAVEGIKAIEEEPTFRADV
jgi:hypothetical protein